MIFGFLFLHTVLAYHSLWDWNFTIPGVRNYPAIEYPSACSNGQQRIDNKYGFACPHMMMLSDDMILAAKKDGLYPTFLYATAGSASDDECGKCYQVKLLDAERQWDPEFKQIVVQVINSGYDVMRGQFDIFMGGGGFGYFTACNNDCKTKYCQGGPCFDFMYNTTFENWNNAQFDDPNICYSGGIKWFNKSDILNICKHLVEDDQSLKNKITIDSCFRTNTLLYHQNFVSLDAKRVACPTHLYLLTGLKRKDNENYPKIDILNNFDIECRGSREQGHYCITTMQDCCKPSCSWSNKGYPDLVFSRADTCDKSGNIYNF